ncbi:MFS transporter [Symbiobacterium terraclitae]|uniref:MFS transporter n=1 Tax=Symbiobacterium terraclitae TaxID=557451 RepID=UPI003159FF66
MLAFLRIPSPRSLGMRRQQARASLWSDVRFGVDYIRRRPPLLWLLATFAVVNLCLPLGVFMPLLVKVNLAADWAARGMTYETALATLNTMMAAGGLAGGVLVSIWGGARRRRVVVLLLTMALGGVAQVGLGFMPGLYLAGAAAFLISFCGPMSNAHSQAIWQGQVPREAQGRVFAVRRVMAQGLHPLGQVLAGWLAARLDPGVGLALLGGVITLVSGAQLLNQQVMRVEDRAYVEGLASRAEA